MKNPVLTCKLIRSVVTDEGDFIPAGTPVEVFGWGTPESGTVGKLECRAAAYVYCDTWKCREIDGADRPAVGSNFWLATEPDNLAFVEIEDAYWRRPEEARR